MVVIRLTRVGKKNSPAYRVVVADKRRAVKRKFIEVIGHYNPILKPKEVVIDKERALFWLSKGAAPSDTVRNLMADLEIIKKSEKIKKVYGRAKKKKEIKEELEKKPEIAKEEESKSEEPEDNETKEEDTGEVSGEASEETADATSAPADKNKGDTAGKTAEEPAETNEDGAKE